MSNIITAAVATSSNITYTTGTTSNYLSVNQPITISGIVTTGLSGIFLVTGTPAYNQFVVSNTAGASAGTSTSLSGTIYAELVIAAGGGGNAGNIGGAGAGGAAGGGGCA
jgi:hypothetical protein